MAFAKAEKATVFRTKTAGDFVLGRFVSIEPGQKGPVLTIESYSDTEKVTKLVKGQPVEQPKPIRVIVYNLDVVREIERRVNRVQKGKEAAAKAKGTYRHDSANDYDFIIVECVGEDANGYGAYEVSASNSKADMSAEKAERGSYMVLHAEERAPRDNNATRGPGGTAGNGGGLLGGDDDDLAF